MSKGEFSKFDEPTGILQAPKNPKWNTYSGEMVFEVGKEYQGWITITDNPFKDAKQKAGEKKRPEYVLAFNGKPCRSHKLLQDLADDIFNKKLKAPAFAKIVFNGVSGKGSNKFASYSIDIAE